MDKTRGGAKEISFRHDVTLTLVWISAPTEQKNSLKERAVFLSRGSVAQLVERWTPYGGSIRPGVKSPGFEARRVPDVYRASCGYGCGWWQTVTSRSQR